MGKRHSDPESPESSNPDESKKTPTPRYMKNKVSKIKDKEIKAAREKQLVI